MATAYFPEDQVTTYVDNNAQQVAEIDPDSRRFELGGLNNAGEDALLILRDGHGREVFRFNAGNGNLTVGGLNPEQNQDGDITLKDSIGREIIHLSAGNARVTIGGGETPSILEIQDTNGEAAISLNGDKKDIRVGGQGDAGRLMAADANGKVTAGLDGGQSGLLLRSPDGSIFKVTVSNSGDLTTTAL
jgi:hypothetical protein